MFWPQWLLFEVATTAVLVSLEAFAFRLSYPKMQDCRGNSQAFNIINQCITISESPELRTPWRQDPNSALID